MKAPSELATSPLLRVLDPKARPAAEGDRSFNEALQAVKQDEAATEDNSEAIVLPQLLVKILLPLKAVVKNLPETPPSIGDSAILTPELTTGFMPYNAIKNSDRYDLPAWPAEDEATHAALVSSEVSVEIPEEVICYSPDFENAPVKTETNAPVILPVIDTGKQEGVGPQVTLDEHVIALPKPSYQSPPWAPPVRSAPETPSDTSLSTKQTASVAVPQDTLPLKASNVSHGPGISDSPGNPAPETEALSVIIEKKPALKDRPGVTPLPLNEARPELAAQVEAAFAETAKGQQKEKGKRANETTVPSATAATLHSPQGAVAALLQIAEENRASAHNNPAKIEQGIEKLIADAKDSTPAQNQTTLQTASVDNLKTESFAKTFRDAMHTPVTEQVHVSLSQHLKNGDKHFTIQLDPGDLGKVEVRLEIAADGKTVASIMADNKDTLDLLQRDARALERALSEAGLKTDSGSLSFNLRSGGQEQQSAQGGGRNKFFREDEAESELGVVIQMAGQHARASLSALDIKV